MADGNHLFIPKGTIGNYGVTYSLNREGGERSGGEEGINIALLATGGKDSTLVLSHLLKKGANVKYLVSMVPLSEESWMFHFPNIRLVTLFAKAVDLPLISAETAGIKEREIEDLKKVLEPLEVDAVASGVVTSNYQKSRVEKLCKQLKLRFITPLWHTEPSNILREILNCQWKVIITGVSSYGLTEEWLGRKLDEDVFRSLFDLNKRYGVSLIGEGGEYETLVLDAPFFIKRIEILRAKKVWRSQSGYLSITKARLVEKKEEMIPLNKQRVERYNKRG